MTVDTVEASGGRGGVGIPYGGVGGVGGVGTRSADAYTHYGAMML